MADFHHIPIDAALQASSPKKCKMHGLILSLDSMLHRFHIHSWSPQAFPGKKLLCCPPAPDTQLTPLPYLLSTDHTTALHKASPAPLATAPSVSAQSFAVTRHPVCKHPVSPFQWHHILPHALLPALGTRSAINPSDICCTYLSHHNGWSTQQCHLLPQTDITAVPLFHWWSAA